MDLTQEQIDKAKERLTTLMAACLQSHLDCEGLSEEDEQIQTDVNLAYKYALKAFCAVESTRFGVASDETEEVATEKEVDNSADGV